MYLNSFRLFLFILIFTPLAFGTVHQWSLTILECLSIGALLIFLISLINKKDLTLYEIPGIVPLLCLWAYFVLQIIPLPSFVVRFVSPETYKIYAETVGIIEPTTWISLSIHKKSTLLELFRFSGYIAFYVLTIQLLTNKDLLKKTISVVIIFSSLLAFYALIQHFFGSSNKIYWLKETYGASPFGPFVNRNHYAGFMGMLFPVALGIFLALKVRGSSLSFIERLVEFFKEKRTNIYLLIGLGCIIIALSVFLSLSRGGIISLSLSMLFFIGLLLIKGTKRKRIAIVLLIMTFIVILVGWFGWEPILNRFEKIMNLQGNIADLRIVLWKDCFQVISNFPLTGTGFGTFVDIFPKYTTITEEIIVQHAHNDYIELLINGGIIAFFLAGWFIITVILRSFRSFLRRKDSYAIYLYIGSIAGLAAILFHSFTDFNLQIGSNGLYFFFLMGLMVSSSHTRLHNGINKTYLPSLKLKDYRILSSLTAIVFIFVLILNLGMLISNHYYSFIKDLRIERISREALVDARNMALKASLFDPIESIYSHKIADTYMMTDDIEMAKKYYLKALKLNILNGEYAQKLGLVYISEDVTTTERLLRAGIASEPTNDNMYKTYAAWLLSINRKGDALIHINTALSILPTQTTQYISFMKLQGLSDDEIKASLPERVMPYMAFADYLLSAGKENEAEELYLQSLHFVGREKEIKAAHFYKVYEYYAKSNRFDEALKVMLLAKDLMPANGRIRYTLGTIYEKLDVPDMAVKEYKETLIIEPYNKNAKKRLHALTEIKN